MRPYKYKFRRAFVEMIHSVKPYKNVLDVACANAKFRAFFGETDYTGIDLSEKTLSSKTAIDNLNKFESTKLFVGDLSKPEGLAIDDKFDLVVSTHTIAHIKSVDEKKIAAHNLINSINNKGHLIIQLKNNCLKEVKPILDSDLILIKHVRYKGILSNILEKKFLEGSYLSFLGKIICIIFSYIDFGRSTENLLLYIKKK